MNLSKGVKVLHRHYMWEGVVTAVHPTIFKGRPIDRPYRGYVVQVDDGEIRWCHENNLVVLCDG